MVTSSARDRLVESASRLFYRNGFHATGIEKVLAAAKVSKMTLYRHFRSKDELIMAVISSFDERFRVWLTVRVEAASDDPVTRLGAVFEALEDILTNGAFEDLGFHGCPLVKAASEFDDLGDPIHRIAADHKRWLMDYIAGLVRETPARNPDELSLALFLEFEGAYITAQVIGDPGIARQAQKVAKLLIDSSLSR